MQGARVKAMGSTESDLAQVRFVRCDLARAGADSYASSAEVRLCGRCSIEGLCGLGKPCGAPDEVGGERRRCTGGKAAFGSRESFGFGEPQFACLRGAAEHE